MEWIRTLREEDGFNTLLLTILSGVFLVISFFRLLPGLPIDPAWAAILISGLPILWGAVKGLVTEFDVTADVLVAIALVAAVIIGEYFAAGEVAFIMQLGKVLEDYTAGRSHQSLQALIRLTPQKATLRSTEGDREILASEVQAGDLILVRPGEAIPVDGRIRRGSTSVDQALMTGESVPVDKTVGDEVFQGTLNQQGAIDLEAIRVGVDSSLRKMIHLVAEAERDKAPIVRIADRWARYLVPFALACALVIWIWTGDDHRAVTALVVFCPCSLILATPTAMMAAIGNATKQGILIKSGAAVEAMSRIDTLVMDKTGTMTHGRLSVEDILVLDGKITRNEFLRYAGSAEKFSEHPIGKAVAAYAGSQGISLRDPDHFEMITGKGVASVVDGVRVLIGEKIITEAGVELSEEVTRQISRLQDDGKTVLPVAMEGHLVGLLAIADTLRAETGRTISRLKQAGVERVIMLTGDNQQVARAVAEAAGTTEFLASQLPEDKVTAVRELKDKGHQIAMIGDGVNDAPALATAHVGMVMGAMGSDVAVEAADIALMGDDLSKLPFLVRLTRLTRRRILFNITISMFINFGAIILAGLGWLNPVSAAIVHNFGSVFVVVNSARLLGFRDTAEPLSHEGGIPLGETIAS